MAFVNEYIPQEDIGKYHIEEIDKRYFKLTFQPDWTIDRERDIYLRQVASGREEFSFQKTYTFYWKGSLISVKLDQRGGGVRGGEGWSDYKLMEIDLPEQLMAKRQEILMDLKEALSAYRGGGVYSTRAVSNDTFNF